MTAGPASSCCSRTAANSMRHTRSFNRGKRKVLRQKLPLLGQDSASSLVCRSAAVSEGEIWIDTFDSVTFKLCVGVIHGVSGIGGYWGGVRLMSDGRDFLGRECSWCFVAFFCTW